MRVKATSSATWEWGTVPEASQHSQAALSPKAAAAKLPQQPKRSSLTEGISIPGKWMGKEDGFLFSRTLKYPLQLVVIKISKVRTILCGTKGSLPASSFNHYNNSWRLGLFSSSPYGCGNETQIRFSDLAKVPWLSNNDARIVPAALPACKACTGSHCRARPPRVPESSSLDPRPLTSTLQKSQGPGFTVSHSGLLACLSLMSLHSRSSEEPSADSLQPHALTCCETSQCE